MNEDILSLGKNRQLSLHVGGTEESARPSPDTPKHDFGEEQRRARPMAVSDEQPRQREDRLAWIRLPSHFYRSLVVENKGNVARDHLSAERTFLAYVRTSLVCVTAGVAVVQLLTVTPSSIPLRLSRFGKALGSVVEVLGITILLVGVTRYFSVQNALLDGKYRAASLVIWLIGLTFVILVLTTFGLMLGITFS